MPNILQFSRNRCTCVEEVDPNTLRSTCRLQDTLMEASVEVLVRLPDLEIVDVKGEVRRSNGGHQVIPTDSLQKVLGVRVGPGMLKIIKGLVGGETRESKQLAFMVEECCHGVILSFTKEELLRAPRPKDPSTAKDFYASMVRQNIRLYNRCAAFSRGSSLVEGIEPPAGAEKD